VDGPGFLTDKSDTPFIGTKEAYVEQDRMPQGGKELFVESSAPMSNGWRVSVIVPRTSLVETFAQLRRPIVIASAVLLLCGTAIVSILVGRIAARAHRLAGYFRETLEDSTPLRQLFRTRDEFSFLNRQFNQVMNDARAAEEEKLARERTFRFLVEQAPVGFFRSRQDGVLLYMNPHCAAMLGYSQSEAMERISTVRELYYDGRNRDLFLEELSAHREVRHRKIRFMKKTGERIWISMTARIDPGTDDAGESGGYETVALIVFDVDEFKSINDTHGHDVGDRLLQHVVSLAQRLQAGIDRSSPPEPLSDPPTLSIGVGVLNGPEVQVPELLKAADTAMYRAKQGGRNRIECTTERSV
jgi:PAS domain S-box-containing protein